MPSLRDQFKMDDEEYNNYINFRKLHGLCKPEVRGAMIEEDCAPTMASIIMRDSSIGVNIAAKCHVCGVESSINSDERNDSA
jgi:hypothetical protein